MKIDTQLC